MITHDYFILGPFRTNLYFLDKAGGSDSCVIVDAPLEAERYVPHVLKARKLRLDAILLTHGHLDHVCGVPALLEVLKETQSKPPEVFAHEGDRNCFEHPESYCARCESDIPEFREKEFRPIPVSRWLSDGETFTLLGEQWTAIHVPGHTPGGLVYYCAKEKMAFVGDVIFPRGLGRTDFPGGDTETLENAVQEKIYTLPSDVTLYPGHSGDTTVSYVKTPYHCI